MRRTHLRPPDLAAFSTDYFEARARFLEAARRAGGLLATYTHPERGPGQRELATDVARFGPRDATDALLLICGTHGVEGLPGSACLLDWLAGHMPATRPTDMAAVLVHALNPYGVAWRQRQTEDNVDLNRNCRDFAATNSGASPLYDEFHDALVRAQPGTAAWTAASAELDAARTRQGDAAYYAAIMAGQSAHADGLFYSGAQPTWSHRTLRTIMADHVPAVARLAIVDFHTGLGAYGCGVLGAADRPGSGSLERARIWFGPGTVRPIHALIDARAGTPAPMQLLGDLGSGLQAALPATTITSVALEYGTYEVERFLEAYRANCWMQRHGSRTDAVGQQIAAAFEAFFYPRSADWQELILARARQVTRQATAGLKREGMTR